MKVKVKSLSCVQLFATLWTIAHQVALSVGFSRKECWSGLPCPPSGDLPDQEIKVTSLMSPAFFYHYLGRYFIIRYYRKKYLNYLDNHDGVITLLEPDILECELKWALGSITTKKSSGSDRISAELFQILKDDAVKVLYSISQQIWKTQQWPQDWKRSVFILIPKKGNAKKCSNYCTIALISHSSKVMLKILQAKFQ